MKATISFELVDKKIGLEDVSGLVSLEFDPVEIGKKALLMIESIASPKIVVGFAEPGDISFFMECGWATGGVYEDKILVASDAINECEFDDDIW